MSWSKIKRLILNKFKIIGTDRLKTNDQITLFKNLYELFLSGFSLHDSLDFLKLANFNSKIINQILIKLERGALFSDSIKPFVGQNISDQVKLAEKHGNIIPCLKAVTKYITLKNNQRKKIREIIVYTFFLILLLIVIIVGIKIWVTPQLNGLIQQKNNSKFLNLNFYYLFLALGIGMFFILQLWFRKSKFDKIDLIIKIPVIGRIYQNYYGYYIASNLSLMLKSGMDIKDILDLMTQFNHNSLMYQLGMELRLHLNQGDGFKSITTNYSFIPQQILLFISKGDPLDRVAKNLDAFASLCFKKIESDSNRLIGTIQPIMFAIIGIIIIPNLSNQRKKAQSIHGSATTSMIQTQIDSYLNTSPSANVKYDNLQNDGYLTSKQVDEAKQEGIQIINNHAEKE